MTTAARILKADPQKFAAQRVRLADLAEPTASRFTASDFEPLSFPTQTAATPNAATDDAGDEGDDPALRRMVLVGHSMGGLHAKVQASSPGTALWDAIAYEPFERLRLPAAMRRMAQQAYFFEAAPHVTRIVCIATPHRGSILASLGVGQIGRAHV